MGGGALIPALTALLCLGLCRAPGDGAQVGTLPKASIWADPGSLVAVGSPVTLWCQGSLQAEVYGVYKEGSPQPWERQPQQDSRHKASFAITTSMSSHDTGQYWCVYQTPLGLSQPSDPLTLVVTGMFLAPSLSAQPSPVVASGGNVSLSCGSEYDDARTFHLLKEGGASPLQSSEARFSQGAGVWQATFLLGSVDGNHGGIYRCYRANPNEPHAWSLPSDPLELQVTGLRGTRPPSPDFLLGPVSGSHGARYRCYGGLQGSYVWSAPSGPLDVLVAGMYSKPSLQAQPGPSVSWGAMVALRCGSQEAMDTFLLHREGSGTPPQRLRVLGSATAVQATFTLGPVTSAHGGTYRCYCAHSTDPYLWSQPSDPLQLEVSGGLEGQLLTTKEPNPTPAVSGLPQLKVLLGVSVAAFLSLCLLLLLLLLARRHGKGRSESEPRQQRRPHKSSGPAVEAQEGLDAAVKHRHPEDGRLDTQLQAEGPQVTYAQLSHTLQRERTRVTSSGSGQLPEEPCVYTALAVR